jgi:hypothetical protein
MCFKPLRGLCFFSDSVRSVIEIKHNIAGHNQLAHSGLMNLLRLYVAVVVVAMYFCVSWIVLQE